MLVLCMTGRSTALAVFLLYSETMPKQKKKPTNQAVLFPVKKYRYIPTKADVIVTRIKEGTDPAVRAAILASIKYLQ